MRSRFMMALSLGALALAVASTPLFAQGSSSVCKDGTTSAASGKGACSGHGGVDAKATEAAKIAAASVTCSDGSSSKPGRGACSGHGGVKGSTTSAAKTAPTPVPAVTAAKAPTATAAKKPAAKGGNTDPTDATAQCKDSTYSHAKTHQGACSGHGGVAKFLK